MDCTSCQLANFIQRQVQGLSLKITIDGPREVNFGVENGENQTRKIPCPAAEVAIVTMSLHVYTSTGNIITVVFINCCYFSGISPL